MKGFLERDFAQPFPSKAVQLPICEFVTTELPPGIDLI
jgi:hypothetical protein